MEKDYGNLPVWVILQEVEEEKKTEEMFRCFNIFFNQTVFVLFPFFFFNMSGQSNPFRCYRMTSYCVVS